MRHWIGVGMMLTSPVIALGASFVAYGYADDVSVVGWIVQIGANLSGSAWFLAGTPLLDRDVFDEDADPEEECCYE